MPKLKKVRSGKFTLIQNLIFEDHRLSYKEIGIYCNMMKFPDDWEFSIRYLAECHKDKRDAVRTGIEKKYYDNGQIIIEGEYMDDK